MSSITLPYRPPFNEMMAAFAGDGVNLIMETKTLLKLRVWESKYIDLHAGEFVKLPDNLLMFCYSRRQWLQLCTEIRHFDPERPIGKPFKVPDAEPITEYDLLFFPPRITSHRLGGSK